MNAGPDIDFDHDVLRCLIHPLGLNDFLERYWGQHHLHVSGDSARYRDAFSWRDLDWALESQRLDPASSSTEGVPRLQLFHNRQSLPTHIPADPRTKRPRLDVASLYRRFREGATIVLNAVDDLSRGVRRLSEGLSASFGTYVQVNLYASQGHDEGFGLHWDDHDVFILQLSGSKTWSLYGHTERHPLSRRETLPRPAGPAIEVLGLKEGDCLYLPKGQWHNVTGHDRPSLHLTFSVPNPTGVNFLNWLVEELSRDPAIRTDVPRFADRSTKAAWSHAVRSRLCSLLDGGADAVETFLSRNDSSLPARTRLNLASVAGLAIGSEPRFRLAAQARPEILRADDSGTITFRSGGRETSLPAQAGPILRRLAKMDQVAAQDLSECANTTPDELRELMARLLNEGLVNIEGVEEGGPGPSVAPVRCSQSRQWLSADGGTDGDLPAVDENEPRKRSIQSAVRWNQIGDE